MEGTESFAKFIDAVRPQIHDATLIILAVIAALSIIFAIYVAFRLAKAEDEGKRSEAKKQIMWSVIAVIVVATMFVLLSTLFDPVDGIFGDRTLIKITTDPANPDIVIETGAALVEVIGSAVGAFLELCASLALLFAVYLGFRLAMAEDEGKRKEAKAQVFWTIIAVILALALAMIIERVMIIVANSLA